MAEFVSPAWMPSSLREAARAGDATADDLASGAAFAPDATTDDVVRGAEELADVGVAALVTGAMGPDPGGWLESTFGPAMDRIAAIEPRRF